MSAVPIFENPISIFAKCHDHITLSSLAALMPGAGQKLAVLVPAHFLPALLYNTTQWITSNLD